MALEVKRISTQELINLNDTEFKEALDQYKYADRFPEFSMEVYRDKVAGYLKAFDNRLNDRAYMISDKLTLADIAIFPFIRQCAFVNREWFDSTPYMKLQAWLNSVLESQLFNDVMIKHTQWISEK